MPFQPTVRKRRLKGPTLHARLVQKLQEQEPYETLFYYDDKLNGVQITESEGHPFHHKYKGKDEGGAFRTMKKEVHIMDSSFHYEGTVGFTGGNRKIDATVTPNFHSTPSQEYFVMPSSVPVNSDVDEKGATAVSLCNPLNPVASASTFLTEAVHERLPSLPGVRLWKGRTKALLGIADEFLNAEFGWLPMMKDIKEIAEAVSHASTVMAQYQRDAGKLVRRSFYYPTEHTDETNILDGNSRLIMGGELGAIVPYAKGNWDNPSRGNLVENKLTQRKTWFKGAFTYPVPDQSDAWSRMMGAASGANAFSKVFGSSLTPQTLWEITPWSWALDWFSNTQDVIENLDLFELQGLVMPYGYVMDETKITQTFSYEPLRNIVMSVPSTPVVVVSTIKTRTPANPFGFGLEWDDLSVTQLAILAALGITLAL